MWGSVSEPSDESLLLAYRGGDAAAFEALFLRYRSPLFNVVLRFVGDRGYAEEIYQDVWMTVVERCGDFQGSAKFSAWLYTIARNRCIDHRRKQRLRAHSSLEHARSPAGKPLGDRLANPGPSTEGLASGALLGAHLASAVGALPDEQREVFLMRHLQGLAFHEIADVTGTPANTVKSRMRYALESLRHSLRDWKEDNDM